MKYLLTFILLLASAWGQVNGYSIPATAQLKSCSNSTCTYQITVGPGSLSNSAGSKVSYAGGTFTLTVNGITYGYVDYSGNVSTGASVPAGDFPLFKVITTSTDVTSVTDLRSSLPTSSSFGSLSGANTWTGAQTFANLNGSVYSATANGMKCDDATDDTAAFNALLSKVNTAGGGTIYISGMCLLNSLEITFPNDGQAQPKQSNIRITSSGAPANGQWGVMPTAAAGLDLRFNATDAKLVTLGIGKLEIDHLFLKDGGADCASFLMTTNTTLLFHDNTVSGTASGTSACNDGVILGGTGTTAGNLASSMFQGYGTVIQNNWFDKTKRGVLLQSAANNVIVRDNSFSTTSGYSTGGAIETNGNASLYNTGNIITGNLIEVPNYKYGINLPNFATENVLLGNGCYDASASNTSCINFGAGADYSLVVSGFGSDSPQSYMTDADGTATLFTSHQNKTNIMPQPWLFVGGSSNPTPTQTTEESGQQISAYDIMNKANNDEIYQQLGAGPTWYLVWKPAGSTAEFPFSVGRASATATTFFVGKAGDTSDAIFSPSGADLRLRSNNAGNVVWLCGGTNCTTYNDASGDMQYLGAGTGPSVMHLMQHANHDLAGACTAAAATTCTVTFTTAYNSAPVCTATDATNIVALKVTPSTTGLVITTAASSSDVFDYVCIGNPN